MAHRLVPWDKQPDASVPIVGIPGLRPAFAWSGANLAKQYGQAKPWARGSSLTQVAAGMGRGVTFTGNTTNAFTAAGHSTSAHARFTAVAVFIWRSGAANNFPQLMGDSGNNNGWRIGASGSGGGDVQLVKGSVASMSNVSVTSGVPYVMVTSSDQITGETYMLTRSLIDGSILRNATTNTSSSTAPNGVCGVGISRTDFSGAWNGDIFMAFASYDSLPEGRAYSLLANPWQLFAPRSIWLPTYLSSSSDTALTPGVGALTLTGYAPTVDRTAHVSLTPGVLALTLTGYAPTVAQTANVSLTPDVAALTLTTYAPDVVQAGSVDLMPGAGSLTLTTYEPTVTVGGNGATGGWPTTPSKRRRDPEQPTAEQIQAQREAMGILPKREKLKAKAKPTPAPAPDVPRSQGIPGDLQGRDLAIWTELLRQDIERGLSMLPPAELAFMQQMEAEARQRLEEQDIAFVLGAVLALTD